MKRYLTNEEKTEILSKSNRFTAKQLAEQYGCSRSTILKLWMDNNYHKPPSFSYYVNENYFSNIDTPNKAYIVGIIASDGNLYKRNDEYSGQIRLSFKTGDSEQILLTNIMNDMEATNPIKTVLKRNNNKCFDHIATTIVSQQIFDDLCSMGITPRKTWDMKIDNVMTYIPKQFIRDFLRGYFDGDGCITGVACLKPSKTTVTIAMPLSNAKLLQDYFGNIGIESGVSEDKRPIYTHPFARLDFFGANKYIFLKWLYYNDCLCLERKRNLAFEYCDMVEKSITNRAENIRAVDEYKIFTEQNDY